MFDLLYENDSNLSILKQITWGTQKGIKISVSQAVLELWVIDQNIFGM